jgi:hypothetical protein
MDKLKEILAKSKPTTKIVEQKKVMAEVEYWPCYSLSR